MTLEGLPPGRKALVTRVLSGSGNEHRIHELGIVPGAQVEVLASYPLRGSMLVKLDRTRIALSNVLAGKIEVEQT